MSKKNQIDLEIIFPLRGKIFDRNKVLIAKNEKVYDVSPLFSTPYGSCRSPRDLSARMLVGDR